MTLATSPSKDACLKVKGSLLPFTIIELHQTAASQISQELASKVNQAPLFFESTPVVISLENLSPTASAIDFNSLIAACRENGMVPVAVRGGSDLQHSQAIQCGLALLPHLPGSSRKSIDLGSTPGYDESHQAPRAERESTDTQSPTRGVERQPNPNRVITQPVRSGQQIYAPGGDLVILSSVSPGAEVLADGNIHIYGPLRGRALAGIKGDGNARIFCQRLEAELISIAGNYKISEDLHREHWKQSVQVSLDGDRLVIVPLQ